MWEVYVVSFWDALSLQTEIFWKRPIIQEKTHLHKTVYFVFYINIFTNNLYKIKLYCLCNDIVLYYILFTTCTTHWHLFHAFFPYLFGWRGTLQRHFMQVWSSLVHILARCSPAKIPTAWPNKLDMLPKRIKKLLPKCGPKSGDTRSVTWYRGKSNLGMVKW